MRSKCTKIVSLFLASALTASLFAGCGKSGSTGTDTGSSTAVKNTEAVAFPLKTPIKLRYWTGMQSASQVVMQSYAEADLYKELEKRTGIQMEFQHPTGTATEQLNLMIASNDLPDIIEGGIENYSGGRVKAFDDKVIIDMADLQKKYAPNMTAIYNTYPDLRMDIETEDGKVLFVPFIRGDNKLRTFQGVVVRKDWLNELGLKEPTTIDDWYNMLKAFKDKKGAKAPLTGATGDISNAAWVSAFGVVNDFFNENGKVKYGPADPRFKDYLTTLAKWYKEGLLDAEFPTNNSKTLDAKITGDQTGAFLTTIGGGIGKYVPLMKDKNPKFDLVGVQYPVSKQGDKHIYIQADDIVRYGTGCAYITSANKYPKETMAWFDYGFSKEGHMLYNFGIEGVSYKMENGYPKYTSLITNNPDKIPFANIATKYMRSTTNGPFVQDPRYIEQYADLPQSQAALKTWLTYSKDSTEANIKVRGNLTPDETNQIASKITEINTFKAEKFLKFVMGQEPLDNFDAYVQQMKKMGLDDIIKVKQTAQDRLVAKFPNAAKPKEFNVNDFYNTK